LYQMWARI